MFIFHFHLPSPLLLSALPPLRMNGNWGGIASRDFDRSRNGVGNQNHDGFGPDPSLDVINTIIASYAASAVDENEDKARAELSCISPRPKGGQREVQNYYYRGNHDEGGPTSPRKSSTPKQRSVEVPIEDQRCNNRPHDRYIHPLALKLKLQEASNAKEQRSNSDAHSNHATDNESDHRSEAGESFTQLNNIVSTAINTVSKKLQWATLHLEETASIDGSINAVKLISECALTISNLKRARK